MTDKITASKLEILATIITGDAARQSTNSTHNLYSQLRYRTLGDLQSLFRMFEITIGNGTRHNETLDGLVKLNEANKIYEFILEIVSDENLECLNQKVLSQDRQIVNDGNKFSIQNLITMPQPHKNIENYENLEEFIKTANKNLKDGDYWEVITKARTILETTFKEICTQYNLDFDSNNIVKTFGNIRMHFKMDSSNKDFPNHIKGLIANTITLVQNITEARNKSSSSHAPEYKPKKHHAQFCLEQAISLMNFIIGVDEWTHNKNGGSDGT
jgi:hypothetical protein